MPLFNLDEDLHGWHLSVSGNVNPWLSVVGDFSGHGGRFDEPGFIIGPKRENVRQHIYSFLAGPRLNIRRNGRLNPFAHIVFGISQVQSKAIGLRFGVCKLITYKRACLLMSLLGARFGFQDETTCVYQAG